MTNQSETIGHIELAADIAQAFASSLNIQDTLRVALRQIMQHLNAEAASIFMLDANGEELVCRACAGPVKIDGVRIHVGQGIVGKTVRENRTHMIRDASDDPDFSGAIDSESGFTTRSVLCAPLVVKDERIGAIELINKKSGDGLFNEQDENLLMALSSSASLAIHNSKMAQQLLEQERLRKELELAAEIQRNLLPASSLSRSNVYGINMPARVVSGDFYDYFHLADGRVCFNIADVAGKGINAALLMAKASSLFHCLGKEIQDPGRLLSILNNELVETSTRGMFVTMVGGVYDPVSGIVRIANAGHPPALLISASGDIEYVAGSSPPLGILADLDYPEVEVDVNQRGFYLYTDGITDAFSADSGRLGDSGFEALLRKHAHVSPAERLQVIVDDIHRGVDQLSDDMTVLLIEQPNR